MEANVAKLHLGKSIRMKEREKEEEELNNGNNKKSCKNTIAVIISIQLNEASSDDIK